jgi:hypothetical protein
VGDLFEIDVEWFCVHEFVMQENLVAVNGNKRDTDFRSARGAHIMAVDSSLIREYMERNLRPDPVPDAIWALPAMHRQSEGPVLGRNGGTAESGTVPDRGRPTGFAKMGDKTFFEVNNREQLT